MADPEPEPEAGRDKAPAASPGLSRWTPSIPTNFIAALNPFAGDNTTTSSSAAAAESDPDNASTKKPSLLSSLFPTSLAAPTPKPTASASPSVQDDDSAMFAEPETRSNSDGGSPEGSVNELGPRKRRRCDKSKTCYSICHPPPTSTKRHRLHRRPRSLIQLHRLCPTGRPQPAFDVIHSTNFSVKLTKAITKVFRAKHGLCPNDLVVLKAEKYSAGEPDEEQEARDIIALICKGRKEDGQYTGKAKICFADGREWDAAPTATGGYEFFTIDEHGLGITMRWVPKRNKDGSKPRSKPTAESGKSKFNFSTISPNSRRHPVIASLGKTGLDINDTYRIPDAGATTPLGTPRRGSTVLADTMVEESEDADLRRTDDRLREVIVISGIWVAFKEGWSPTFKYDDKDKDGNPAVPRSPSLRASLAQDRASVSSLLSTPPGSPGPKSPAYDPRFSFQSNTTSTAGLFQRTSLLARGNRNSVPDAEFLHAGATSPPLESPKKTGRSRADSASTVLVHRAASNRMRNSAHKLDPQPEAPTTEARSSESSTRSRSDPAVPSAQRASPTRTTAPTATGENHALTAALAAAGTGESTPSRSRSHHAAKAEKRESSAASATTSSTSDGLKRPQPQARKKKGRLMRLLCGSGK